MLSGGNVLPPMHGRAGEVRDGELDAVAIIREERTVVHELLLHLDDPVIDGVAAGTGVRRRLTDLGQTRRG